MLTRKQCQRYEITGIQMKENSLVLINECVTGTERNNF